MESGYNANPDTENLAIGFLGSLREPLVIIGIFEHCALGFGIAYVLRESASLLSAVQPMLGIVD